MSPVWQELGQNGLSVPMPLPDREVGVRAAPHRLCPWGRAPASGKTAGLGVGAQESQLVLGVSHKGQGPDPRQVGCSSSSATHERCTWEEKETCTSNGRCFLTLTLKLMPVRSISGRRESLCMIVGMALMGSCTPRDPGAVGEDAFALPQPRVVTILCSMYSHVPSCRWWRSPPLCG